MRAYTAHVRSGRLPVLVPEGFSWGALFFGPLWLLRHGAGVAAALTAAAFGAALLAPPAWRPLLSFGVLLATGLFGNDLRRWALELHGFRLGQVVAARSRDEALLRLLVARGDLRGGVA